MRLFFTAYQRAKVVELVPPPVKVIASVPLHLLSFTGDSSHSPSDLCSPRSDGLPHPIAVLHGHLGHSFSPVHSHLKEDAYPSVISF